MPDTNSQELDRGMKEICGYSYADWAGDPSIRKSMCFVERFFLTSECKQRGRGYPAENLSCTCWEPCLSGLVEVKTISQKAISRGV